MKRSTHRVRVGIATLAAFALVGAACGGDDDADTDEPSAEESAEAAADSGDDAPAATDAPAVSGDDGDVADSEFRVAIVAPSASNDLAFTQSIVDSVGRVGETRPLDTSITDGTFVVEDAAAALRGYAEDGFDLVIAHGSQYGGPLQEIAPDFPDVAFRVGNRC